MVPYEKQLLLCPTSYWYRKFMLNQLFINALISSSIYILIAVSFSLIYQTARFFHFAHAVVFTSRF